ncbi:hypothetical protein CsSME_00036513 [Camellia sinensis var. sinensis]
MLVDYNDSGADCEWEQVTVVLIEGGRGGINQVVSLFGLAVTGGFWVFEMDFLTNGKISN